MESPTAVESTVLTRHIPPPPMSHPPTRSRLVPVPLPSAPPPPPPPPSPPPPPASPTTAENRYLGPSHRFAIPSSCLTPDVHVSTLMLFASMLEPAHRSYVLARLQLAASVTGIGHGNCAHALCHRGTAAGASLSGVAADGCPTDSSDLHSHEPQFIEPIYP